MSALFHSKDVDNHWQYWYPKVYGYFYKRIDNKFIVEELTAETLNTVFLAENIKNLKAYFWKVAHNYLVRYINNKKTEIMTVNWDENIDLTNENQLSFKIEPEPENSRSYNYNIFLERFMSCIDKHLDKAVDKQILTMAILEEKNSSEIGKILQIQPGNVRTRLHRTIKKLKTECLKIWQDLI